jgi:hypothetical protein
MKMSLPAKTKLIMNLNSLLFHTSKQAKTRTQFNGNFSRFFAPTFVIAINYLIAKHVDTGKEKFSEILHLDWE